MSDFKSMMTKEVIGQGHATEDAIPLPKQFRGIPMPVGGVPPTTPAGTPVVFTGSPVSNIPQPV